MAELFLSFFKIGMFTFGGGYAMLPLMQAELVKRKHWISDEEILDYYSIGQATPGIIAINVSTFVGYKLKGLSGALAALVGIVMPSFIVIISIANVLDAYSKNPYVTHAFSGIRIVVIALILDVVLSLRKRAVSDWVSGMIFVIMLIMLVFAHVSPVAIVVIAIALGLFLGRGG